MKNKNIDKENLRQVILDSYKQFEIGFKLAEKIKFKNNFNSVCISGMGGSSLPIDAVKNYIAHLRKKNPKKNKLFSIMKNRGYSLPLEAYENCLNIFISYSGNTEETLSSLEEAIKNKLPSIGIANGGKLLEVCQKNNIPTITIPPISQPRYALGYFFSVILRIFSNCDLLEDTSKEIISSAEKLKKNIIQSEKKGLALAKKIFRKTPVIYTSERFKSVGRIWKIKINENAKTPAFYNFYPELNHNEMLGFSLPQGKFHIVTFLSKGDDPQIQKRMKITAKLLEKKGIKTSFFEIIEEDGMFFSIFSSLTLGDWASYYLALEYKQDPTPVKMVEDLKKMLR